MFTLTDTVNLEKIPNTNRTENFQCYLKRQSFQVTIISNNVNII
jgi:hypothetical protein